MKHARKRSPLTVDGFETRATKVKVCVLSNPFAMLPHFVMQLIMGALGLDGATMRQVCKEFANLKLEHGVALALKALQVGPSVSTTLQALRYTTTSASSLKWNPSLYFHSLKWKVDWAQLLTHTNGVDIDTLIDAYQAIPKGGANFFGKKFLGNPKPHKFKSAADRKETYASHVKLALYKVVEERIWDVFNGFDLTRKLNDHQITNTVVRILEEVGIPNDESFFFTKNGWLKYTPFLLAAKANNLELLQYLNTRRDTDICICSAGGNNARAICKQSSMEKGVCSGALAFLCNLGLVDHPHVSE